MLPCSRTVACPNKAEFYVLRKASNQWQYIPICAECRRIPAIVEGWSLNGKRFAVIPTSAEIRPVGVAEILKENECGKLRESRLSE